jgi:hypothetical protein
MDLIGYDVLMLPTDGNVVGALTMDVVSGALCWGGSPVNDKRFRNQHLYIVSPDEHPQVGDFGVNGHGGGIVVQRTEYNSEEEVNTFRKIIASTDEELGGSVPKITSSFVYQYVEAHNNKKPIRRVFLEVEYFNGWSKLLVEESGDPIGLHTRLKLTDDGECVIIHLEDPTIEKTYSREQVKDKMWMAVVQALIVIKKMKDPLNEVPEWFDTFVKENL